MSDELIELLEAAKGKEMTAVELEEQRISFAYGNTHFENERITRDMVRAAAARLKADDGSQNGRSEG